MEHYSHPMDMPVSEMHVKMVGQISSSPESQQFYSPMSVSSNSSNAVFGASVLSNTGVGHNEFPGGVTGPSQIHIPDNLGSKDASMMKSMGDEITSLPTKRKSEVGPMANNAISPRSLLPNKRPTYMGSDVSSAGFLQTPPPQWKTAPAQSRLGSPVQNSQNKKMVRNDSMPVKSGLQRVQSGKRQTTQIASASKAQPESTEAVRAKMRESLSGALALAVQKLDNPEKNQTEAAVTHNNMDSQTPDLSATNECPGGRSGEAFQGFQYSSIFPDEEVTFTDGFFAKDDLLQGNGLSWAFDFDQQIGEEGKEARHDEAVKEEAAKAVPVLTPEKLAFQIETELFKLFGGVNKKYREKARSLLFNLKDRNNPDLRVSVMSGDISPERLCSMSAEELASKELSQWRMAKAEEFAQMVVLPDTEVDLRRVVRKTHKGEYQVEIDHNDDDIAAEISSGTSMVTQAQPKKVDQDLSGSLVIPTDGTDLMQGMIVDELKDAELLPPIVSLDEFMESLNNEPPFEDLSGDAKAKLKTPMADGETVRKSQGALNQFKKHGGTDLPKDEYIWSCTLQLHLSSSVTVGAIFQSGEKTTTKEWGSSVEMKGRVRVDAFEKFLQQLPKSRTRAVMVLQFVLKDSSSEVQRATLSETIESYTRDERLGYAEPAAGVELYLCPETPRTCDILSKLNPKEKPMKNGLMGVVVWRRAHMSKNNVSPNTTSHHKHTSKTPTRTPSREKEDDDDDVPPGFGPARRDDDDLPEFNFSGSVKMTQRPIEQVREMIKKYGQGGGDNSRDRDRDMGIEPWEDDDDIPEWQPTYAAARAPTDGRWRHY